MEATRQGNLDILLVINQDEFEGFKDARQSKRQKILTAKIKSSDDDPWKGREVQLIYKNSGDGDGLDGSDMSFEEYESPIPIYLMNRGISRLSGNEVCMGCQGRYSFYRIELKVR